MQIINGKRQVGTIQKKQQLDVKKVHSKSVPFSPTRSQAAVIHLATIIKNFSREWIEDIGIRGILGKGYFSIRKCYDYI